ncbi:MAG: restriction endonuclease subunit S [Candidatus Methanoperedens sp.]|nr:restriction endonuclease subunit S [Candidatus Methanoperedens sp.]
MNTEPAHTWKRYPAYKDSGVEWLGEVPEHWKLKKLKYLVTGFLKYGANESAELEDTNLPRYIRITDFGDNGKLKQDTFKSLPLEIAKYYLLENGDILFARSGATVGKTFQFKNHEKSACFAGYLIKASPDEKKILSDYLYLFTKSNSYEMWKNNIFIQATIQNIGADKYNSLTLSVPPLPEQRAIAALLDRETGRIDTLIEKKERQVELLQEKRAALISHAVTKGLDPDVKMKDSGVEWLGEVPEGWEILRLKYCSRINMGQSPSSEDCNIDGIGLPFLQGNAEFNAINPMPKQYCEVARKVSHKGDLLISVRAPVGALNIANQDYGIGRGLCGITTNCHDFNPTFCWYLLHRVRVQLYMNATGSTYDAVSSDDVGNMVFVCPPLPEQRAIAAFLDRKTGRIDILTTKIRESVLKLCEYRTALISAAVTGKIDVREGV